MHDGGKLLGELSLCDFGEEEKRISPSLVWGLNFSIRKKTLCDLGGFNPDSLPVKFQCFQGDGETGLSNKAIEKGLIAFYQPRALVYHEVPSERMTLEYFDKRFFYQGICNSYSEIRRNSGFVRLSKKNTGKPPFKNIKAFLNRLLFPNSEETVKREINFEKEMLFTRFHAFEKAGYNFHQEMAKKVPLVLEWVLKENYFEYSIPGFNQTRLMEL